MSRQGIEQGRATFAFNCANNALKTQKRNKISEEDNAEYYESTNYRSYVKKLPMLIKTNGFGAALAFVFSKRAKIKKGVNPGQKENPKNAYDLIYEQLAKWLTEESQITQSLFKGKSIELSEAVIQLLSPEYRTVTVETLALVAWMSRFAEGLIQDEITENE